MRTGAEIAYVQAWFFVAEAIVFCGGAWFAHYCDYRERKRQAGHRFRLSADVTAVETDLEWLEGGKRAIYMVIAGDPHQVVDAFGSLDVPAEIVPSSCRSISLVRLRGRAPFQSLQIQADGWAVIRTWNAGRVPDDRWIVFAHALCLPVVISSSA
jgi:hypothetical protein